VQNRDSFFDQLNFTLGPLKPFFEDPDVVEIMCNGENEVWVEAGGLIEKKPDCFMSQQNILSTVLALARMDNKTVRADTDTGIVDAEIPLAAMVASAPINVNMRLAAVLAPTALRGHAMCIRKHSPKVLSLDDYAQSGRLSVGGQRKRGNVALAPDVLAAAKQGERGLIELLLWAVQTSKTILVSGATGSGKTTFFKTLIANIPPDVRLLTIEDTPELVVNSPNYVSLKTNKSTGVTPQRLIMLAMRMRPDRILLGELRDETALNFLDAANTGHPGSIATLHANSAVDALTRLETLALEAYKNGTPPIASVRSRVLSTIDLIVHVGKDGMSGVIEEVVLVNREADPHQHYRHAVNHVFSRYST
jgi:pilus assembly protein CpaF